MNQQAPVIEEEAQGPDWDNDPIYRAMRSCHRRGHAPMLWYLITDLAYTLQHNGQYYGLIEKPDPENVRALVQSVHRGRKPLSKGGAR